jgi:hypothetical protein
MKHLSRRRFITLATSAAGIACVPRRLLAAANAGSQEAEPWPSCPRTLPSSGDDENPLVYLLVAMPDAGGGAEVPVKYQPAMHVCYPPTRRPCWCGGWPSARTSHPKTATACVCSYLATRWRFARAGNWEDPTIGEPTPSSTTPGQTTTGQSAAAQQPEHRQCSRGRPTCDGTPASFARAAGT